MLLWRSTAPPKPLRLHPLPPYFMPTRPPSTGATFDQDRIANSESTTESSPLTWGGQSALDSLVIPPASERLNVGRYGRLCARETTPTYHELTTSRGAMIQYRKGGFDPGGRSQATRAPRSRTAGLRTTHTRAHQYTAAAIVASDNHAMLAAVHLSGYWKDIGEAVWIVWVHCRLIAGW